MPSHHYNTDTIERYLTHRMEEEELAKFEGRMQQEESLRQEVAAYRPMLEGFAALRSENFRQKMQEWEGEWARANTDDTELIEWHLDGDLAGEARSRVEQRIEEDEAFAREVAAYRQVREGFSAARAASFRNKMEQWEKEEAQPARPRLKPLWPRLAAAAAVLLLLGFGFNWYARANFSAGAIAEANYQPPLGGATMGDEPVAGDAISQGFEAAHALFEQKQYPAAYRAFDGLLAQLPAAPVDELTRTYLRENSEWSRLLAALAMEKPPMDVQAEALRIASISGHEFQEPAQALLRKLQSPLYRWVN